MGYPLFGGLPLHSLAQDQILVISMEQRVDVGVASSPRAGASRKIHLNVGDGNPCKLIDLIDWLIDNKDVFTLH